MICLPTATNLRFICFSKVGIETVRSSLWIQHSQATVQPCQTLAYPRQESCSLVDSDVRHGKGCKPCIGYPQRVCGIEVLCHREATTPKTSPRNLWARSSNSRKMRLLHVFQFKLENYIDQERPPYAILSYK